MAPLIFGSIAFLHNYTDSTFNFLYCQNISISGNMFESAYRTNRIKKAVRIFQFCSILLFQNEPAPDFI